MTYESDFSSRANELLKRAQRTHEELQRSLVELIDELDTNRTVTELDYDESLEMDVPPLDPASSEPVSPADLSLSPARRRFWNTVWQFSGTDEINAKHWNDWVDERKALGNRARAVRRRNIPGSIGRVFVKRTQDPPKLSENGRAFECYSSLDTRERKGHNQFMVTSSAFEKGTHLPLETEFRFEFDLKINSPDKDRGSSSPPHNVIQLWGPRYQPFGGRGNPPFGLFTYLGKWYIQSFGAPTPMPWKDVRSYGHSWGEIDGDWHHFDLRWKGSLSEGYYSVEMDDEVIKDTSDAPHPTALFHEEEVGPTLHIGTYAPRQEVASACSMRDIKISIRK